MNYDIIIKNVIWVMMLATLLLGFFGHYVVAPTPIKLVFSGAMWFSLVLYPFILIKRNDFDKLTNRLLKVLALLVVAAVVRSSLTAQTFQSGNKWVTMFGNPECMFMMLSPLYVYLGASKHSIVYLKKALQVFLLVGMFGVAVMRFIPASVLWISVVFYPYVSKKYRLYILVSLVMATYTSFFAEETSRTSILIIGFVLASYWLVYVNKNRKLVKLFCYVSVIVPLCYAVYTLIVPGYSVFQLVLDYVFQKTGNTNLATDTRSFLFWELTEDLSKNHAWIFGKGAYSSYFSFYFSQTDEGDFYNRISCEVTFLQALLRGGITYVIVYFSIIIYAIHNALKKSQNKMLLATAVIASGWVFVACMSYLNGCDFKHLGFFLLVGCCLSTKWLNKTDAEIVKILQK